MTDILEQARKIIDKSCEWRKVCDRDRPIGEPCACREAASAILALAEPKWREISEAPKDGTDFQALIPFQKKHHQMVGCFAPDGKFHSWPARMIYSPTHWQPLPLPPKEEQ